MLLSDSLKGSTFFQKQCFQKQSSVLSELRSWTEKEAGIYGTFQFINFAKTLAVVFSDLLPHPNQITQMNGVKLSENKKNTPIHSTQTSENGEKRKVRLIQRIRDMKRKRILQHSLNYPHWKPIHQFSIYESTLFKLEKIYSMVQWWEKSQLLRYVT